VGGINDGNDIECQGEMVRFSLICDGHCLALVWGECNLPLVSPSLDIVQVLAAFGHGLLQYLRSGEWC